ELVVVRSNRIAVMRHSPIGPPRTVLTQTVYARVEAVQAVAVPGLDRHALFLVTSQLDWALLCYSDADRCFHRMVRGTFKDPLARLSDKGVLLARSTQPSACAIAHMYRGIVNVLLFTGKDKKPEEIGVRIEELDVVDTCLLDLTEKAVHFAVLW